MNFIQGDKFIDIADFAYSPKIRHKEDYGNLPNTFHYSKVKDFNIVYTHTMYVRQLFDLIYDDKEQYIVITHNSDMNVDASYKIPNNVIKALNPSTVPFFLRIYGKL